MNKKIISLMLALTMTIGSAVTVFAADTVINSADTNGAYQSEIDVTGTTKVPTIKITVPDTAAVGVNPYGLKYKVGEVDYTDQIVSVKQFIKNESDVAIKVNATVTGTPAGEVVLATAAPAATVTTKTVFMFLDVVSSADGSAATFSEKYDAKAANQIVVGKTAVTKKGLITLAAGDTAATYAAYKFQGAASTAPAKAWTAADKVDVKVVFAFEPVLSE